METLANYLSRYPQLDSIIRSLYIAEKHEEFRVPALTYAYRATVESNRLNFYEKVNELADKFLGSLDPITGGQALTPATLQEWEQQLKARIDKKEIEVGQARNSGLKDSMRLSMLDQGDIYYQAGNPNQAIKTYMRTRDLCTSSEQHSQLAMRLVNPSLHLRNFAYALNNAQKSLSLSTHSEYDQSVAQLILGLCNLHSHSWRQAARAFLAVSPILRGNFIWITESDYAIFTCLTALASFDRQDLKTKLLQNKSFQPILEQEPSARELLESFLDMRYGKMMEILKSYQPFLELDFFLSGHTNELFTEIRNKALVQLVTPFKRVRLSTIAESFALTVEEVESAIARLIMDGYLKARIDSHNKIVVFRSADEKQQTYAKVINMARSYIKNTEDLLLRVSLIKQEVILKEKQE